MPSIYRISGNGQQLVVDVDAIEPVISSSKPGRYLIDDISSAPLPSGHTSRRWGVGTKEHNGTVIIEPDAWDVESA